jgi:hypothetical protein
LQENNHDNLPLTNLKWKAKAAEDVASWSIQPDASMQLQRRDIASQHLGLILD